jgi:hypothetical protein
MHYFLLEVSHGFLARVQVLSWHSECKAWVVLRARRSPLSHSILSEFGSSLMVQGLGQLASQRTAADDDQPWRQLGQREHAFVGQVLAGLEPIDGGRQRVRSGGDHRLPEPQLSAVHRHEVRRGEAGVPEGRPLRPPAQPPEPHRPRC